MKKTLICLLAASMLTASSAGAIFEDVSDIETRQAATALHSLGIVNGTGNGLYAPNNTLTRAEFTTMAVNALGIDSAGGSFSVFADVPHTHWAAPFINAAIRNQDTPFISGYADGSFRPNATVNYAEACTMLLRMLGYTVNDIGANWPIDYIARAQSLGITGSLVRNASDTVTRADAAIMMKNVLTTKTKEGDLLCNKLSGSAILTDAVLLATPESDKSLSSGTVQFYIDGEVKTMHTATNLDKVLIGCRGSVLYDTTDTRLVGGFLPSGGSSTQRTIRMVTREGIHTDMGYIAIPRNTPTMTLGEIHGYDESWFDLPVGSTVTLLYNSTGELEFISSSAGTGTSYIAGTTSVPFGSTLLKNGVSISAQDVSAYDVLTVDPVSGLTLVSSNKITGVYEDASPSFRYPETVTVLGNTFKVPESAASSFQNLELDTRITLLFDAYGQVAGAVPVKNIEADMTGVLTAYDGSQATVALFNGITVSGTVRNASDLEAEEDKNTSLLGKVVKIQQSTRGITLSTARTTTAKNGDWNIYVGTLGSASVAGNVQVYEQVKNSTTLNRIDVLDLPNSVISSSDIKSAICDSSGTVIAIILSDVSGESWVYGWAKDATIETEIIVPPTAEELEQNPDAQPTVEIEYDYRMEFTTLGTDGSSKTVEIKLNGKPRTGLIAIPHTMYTQTSRRHTLTSQAPKKAGTCGVSDFNAYSSVRVGSTTYALADNIPVYAKKLGKFITLRQAKNDYDNFTIYTDSTRARLIVAE